MTIRRLDNRIDLFVFERSHFLNYSINMNIKRIFQDIFLLDIYMTSRQVYFC